LTLINSDDESTVTTPTYGLHHWWPQSSLGRGV